MTAVEIAEVPVESPLRRAVRGSAVYALGNALTQLVAFLLIPVYTRWLTPADYGVLVTVRAVGALLLLLFTLDLGTAVARFYFDVRSNAAHLRRYVGTISVFLLGASLALTLVGLAAGPLLVRQWLPDGTIPFHPYFSLTLWSTFFGVSAVVPLTLLQVRERPVSYIGLTVGRFVVTTTAIVYFVVVRQEGAAGAITGTFIADGTCFVVFGILTWRESARAFDWQLLRQSLVMCLPLVPHLAAHWVLTLSDRLILQRLAPMAEVGIYGLGYNLGMAMAFVVTAFNASWVPVFYDVALRDRAALRTLGRLSTTWVQGLSLIAIGGILFSREALLLMASPTYAAAAAIVPIIIVAYLFNGLYLFPVNSLFVRKDTRWLPVFTGIAAALNIALNLWWIPRAGALGAAWATLIAYAALFAMVFAHAHRRFPMAYDYGRVGLALGAVAASMIAGAWWPPVGPAAAIAGKLAFFGAVLATMWRVGLAHRAEPRPVGA